MDINILIWTALSIGFIHTIVGPDHYLPFVVMSKARNWSLSKTMVIVFFFRRRTCFWFCCIGSIGYRIGNSRAYFGIR